MQIGGTKKKLKPTQPQFVVQLSPNHNEYLKMVYNNHQDGVLELEWVGDPNAATKFDSKFAAKSRVRDLADVPEGRCFKELV